MARWKIILGFLVIIVFFVVYGHMSGNVPETQHNGATL